MKFFIDTANVEDIRKANDNLFYLKLQPCFCVFMILHNFFACMCTLFTKQVFASKYAHAFPVFNDKTVPQSVSHV